MRVRTYRAVREILQSYTHVSPAVALGIGALSGMMAAWITTPFDTIRAHLAVEATKNGNKQSPLHITHNLIQRGGVQRLYSGASVRAIASGMKSAMFYVIFESMPAL